MTTATQQAVIELTPAAVTHIQQLLAKKGPGHAFRLGVIRGKCSEFNYNPEIVASAQEADIAWQQADISLLVPADAVTLLQGTLVDMQDKGLGQKRMVFRNPNVATQCGCGDSFSINKPKGVEQS